MFEVAGTTSYVLALPQQRPQGRSSGVKGPPVEGTLALSELCCSSAGTELGSLLIETELSRMADSKAIFPLIFENSLWCPQPRYPAHSSFQFRVCEKIIELRLQ